MNRTLRAAMWLTGPLNAALKPLGAMVTVGINGDPLAGEGLRFGGFGLMRRPMPHQLQFNARPFSDPEPQPATIWDIRADWPEDGTNGG